MQTANGSAYTWRNFIGAYQSAPVGDALLALTTESYAPGITFVQSRQTLSVAGAGWLAFPNVNAGVAEGVFGPNLLLPAPITRIIALSTTSLEVGAVPVGQASAAQAVTVSNTGTGPLSIGVLTLSGGHAAEFAISSDSCSDQTLAPSGTCSVGLTLTPAAVGALSAQLDIPSDATSGPSAVALAGAASNRRSPSTSRPSISAHDRRAASRRASRS